MDARMDARARARARMHTGGEREDQMLRGGTQGIGEKKRLGRCTCTVAVQRQALSVRHSVNGKVCV